MLNLGLKLFLFFVIVTNMVASQRIITLSPAINEIVFALNKGENIVGNTEYCTYPKKSLSIKKVGGYFNPSLERILALNPTVVIMQQNNYKLSMKLKKLHINTKIVKINSLENIKESIKKIGKVVKKEIESKKIIKKIDNELDRLKNIITNKKILIVIGSNLTLKSRIFVAGKGLYLNDIIESSGNKNAFKSDRKGQPILNMENIIASNPDIVILLAPPIGKKNITKNMLLAPWKSLPIDATKTDSIYIIDKEYAGIPSDRIIYFLKDFYSILDDYKKKQNR